MSKKTDVRPTGTELYFLPVKNRMPFKFGSGTGLRMKSICARVKVTARDRRGKTAVGWGETPLSVQWVWPCELSFDERENTLMEFTRRICKAWAEFDEYGHPMEVGISFIENVLRKLQDELNSERSPEFPMPYLAALVCFSLFDIALHDAYGNLHNTPVYKTYTPEYMNRDLSTWLEAAAGVNVSFKDKYPAEFIADEPPMTVPAWHLIGGLDPLTSDDLTGSEPDDGYPVTLIEWIKRDGMKCLKIKLRGNDSDWDYERLVRVGDLAVEHGAVWLTSDFNCTVSEPEYVNAILDRLKDEHPRTYQMILYVEQPFPYELDKYRIDAHSVSARKPLFLDESAHDWRIVRLGRELGWTGVALKTCKTQSGAMLSLCWAKTHGMTLMVQDLTNPMLAQIPHVLLAAYAGTIMGVETNSMQFKPQASLPEEKIHPGLFRRRNGVLNLDTIRGSGYGYRVDEIKRELPERVCAFGDLE